MAQFAKLFSLVRPQHPWSLSGSVYRAYQLRKASAPMEPQWLSLQSSLAQEGLNAHGASVAHFVELISSGRPQRPWSLSGLVCRAHKLRKALAPMEPQ